MGLKTKNHSLGRAIIKDKFKRRNCNSKSHRHTTELDDGLNWNSINIKSITEESTLDEFLASAELAGAEFTAERVNVTIVTENNCLPTKEELQRTKKCQEENVQLLKIPRRPKWDVNTSAEELDALERQTFLEWRKSLAMLSEKEGLILTPYEKNLEFWRQLWRVIEKSDVVVQIVDARNPLFFYCQDLNAYINEMGVGKVNLLLVNKADFLTKKQRTYWHDYFSSVGIKIIFWSATNQIEEQIPKNTHELDKIDKDSDEDDEDTDVVNDEYSNVDTDEDSDEGKDTNFVKNKKSENYEIKNLAKTVIADDLKKYGKTNQIIADLEKEDVGEDDCGEEDDENICKDHDDNSECKKMKCDKKEKTSKEYVDQIEKAKNFVNKTDIVTVDELIEILRSFKNPNEPILTVGLIGYPNVGKSSTINMLLTKRVSLNDQEEKSKMYQTSVSTTPGKTKHFQTFYLDKDLLLCDCPGLVMPMFVNAKAEMITNGILSIDHMNDFVPPISIVCRIIPKDVLEAFYSIMLPSPQEGEDPQRPPTAYELLTAYARIRGFMTHKGVPDYQRASRIILKDLVTGRLNYCCAPPNVSDEDYGCVPTLASINKLKNKPETGEGTLNSRPADRKQPRSELDEEFFKKINVGFVMKGDLSSIGLKHLNPLENFGKPSKKHFKSNKREKSRRTNSHFDA